jgi:hypothetical protein
MAIGWLANNAEADGIIAKRPSSAAWDAAASAQQDKALWWAFYRLIDDPAYNLSDTTPATAALKRAQCELAYYLLKHLAAEDHRLGIQAQSVTQAGIVQETYDGTKLPIPATVAAILEKAGAAASKQSIFVAAIGRDDAKDQDEKITEYSEQD